MAFHRLLHHHRRRKVLRGISKIRVMDINIIRINSNIQTVSLTQTIINLVNNTDLASNTIRVSNVLRRKTISKANACTREGMGVIGMQVDKRTTNTDNISSNAGVILDKGVNSIRSRDSISVHTIKHLDHQGRLRHRISLQVM